MDLALAQVVIMAALAASSIATTAIMFAQYIRDGKKR